MSQEASLLEPRINPYNRVPDSLENYATTREEYAEKAKIAKKDQRIVNGIQSQPIFYRAGKESLKEVALWDIDRKLLAERQSTLILSTLKRLQTRGCQLTLKPSDGSLYIQLTTI
ncbi:MAG: hypothetical protein DK304_000487 [Chloroflexi bacterium]|jgi:hypothetical protein|nr:MAG: hypothetical protein DK304_000487 [Chloroflexota bacterium]